MVYEISREVFIQRLHSPLNFKMIGLNSKKYAHGPLLGQHMHLVFYEDEFQGQIEEMGLQPTDNILLYSFQSGDQDPRIAAEYLEKRGYHFVYYFRGHPGDAQLEYLS